MPDGMEVRFDLRKYRAEMAKTTRNIRKKIIPKAGRAGANVFAKLAKQGAPVLKPNKKSKRAVAGALKRNIKVRQIGKPRDGFEVVLNAYVKTLRDKSFKGKGKAVKRLQFERAGDPYYWYFQEGGWIPRGRGQKITGGERTRKLKRERLMTSGVRRIAGKGFFASAFKGGRAIALRAVTDKVNQLLKLEK